MSQKLTRTINLPKAPASFTDEQKRYMDDFARSLIGQFRDMFDLLGEDAGSLEKHMGDVTAHKMSEGNTASVGVIRTAEGKIRFTSADGTEETDDYGVSAGYVSPALEHIGLSEGIHGATATPTADRIVVFSSGGRLKGASPTEDNDLITKEYYATNTQKSEVPVAGKIAIFNGAGRLQSKYPVSGEDAATYEFVVNAVQNSLARLVFRAKIWDACAAGGRIPLRLLEDSNEIFGTTDSSFTLNPGLYLVSVRVSITGAGVYLRTELGNRVWSLPNSGTGVMRIGTTTALYVSCTSDIPSIAYAVVNNEAIPTGIDIVSL